MPRLKRDDRLAGVKQQRWVRFGLPCRYRTPSCFSLRGCCAGPSAVSSRSVNHFVVRIGFEMTPEHLSHPDIGSVLLIHTGLDHSRSRYGSHEARLKSSSSSSLATASGVSNPHGACSSATSIASSQHFPVHDALPDLFSFPMPSRIRDRGRPD